MNEAAGAGPAQLAQLQGQVAAVWARIGHSAAQLFASRAAGLARGAAESDPRKLYDLWIECAEEAYGAVAHTADYSLLQAELVNASAASLHQHAGRWGAGAPISPLLHSLAAQGAGGSIIRDEGCTRREAIWRCGKTVLYRYLPLPFVQRAPAEPVLICYALVNRPHVLDLQPDRSVIRGLLAAGLEVFLIDWGYPDDGDRELSLGDYVDTHLAGCVERVLAEQQATSLNLAGVCQGGTLSLCYAALNPQRIANLVLLATPVDFQTPQDLLSAWARHLDTAVIEQAGNIPGPLLTGLFLALRPFRLTQHKYVAVLDQALDRRAMELFWRMERWIFDSPDQAARAAMQFVRWLYQENRLMKGSLELGGRPVRLDRIERPILNVYATQDHIVPPSASTALRECIGDADYTELAVGTGHIGLFTSSRAVPGMPRQVAAWIKAH